MQGNVRNEIAKKASKNRRDNEAVEINQLIELLPFTHDAKQKLDKESIIRLIIAYIRLRHSLLADPICDSTRRLTNSVVRVGGVASLSPPLQVSEEGFATSAPPPSAYPGHAINTPATLGCGLPLTCAPHQSAVCSGVLVNASAVQQPSAGINEGELLLEALHGFLILINRKGKVLYVSRNVEDYLGISQEWMLGRWLFEFIHSDDIKVLSQQFDSFTPRAETVVFPQAETYSRSDAGRNFYLRMRHYPNGASTRKKPGEYILVHLTGHVRNRLSKNARSSRPRASGLVCVCRPVQSTSILHISLGGNLFISRHDMRMVFSYCDPRVEFLIGYEPSSLIGRTVYHFHNPSDVHKCSDCHSDLIKTGAGLSKYYRFLGRSGAWVWMQTRATIVSDTRGKPQYVVCKNFIISQEEGERYHMMELQQQMQTVTLPATDLTAKGVIDLSLQSTVTSPASSMGDDHDDTGYNTAVSSTGSASASPNPQCETLGTCVEFDSPASTTSHTGTVETCVDFDSVFSPKDYNFGPEESDLGVITDAEFAMQGVQSPEVLEKHCMLPGTVAAGPCSGMSVLFETDGSAEGCGSHCTTLSSEHSDPFLYSDGEGICGENISTVMDMELLEDFLEKIKDCDKISQARKDTLSVSSNKPETCEILGNLKDNQKSKFETSNCESSKPPSILRSLLDQVGEALADHPAGVPKETIARRQSDEGLFSTKLLTNSNAAVGGVRNLAQKCVEQTDVVLAQKQTRRASALDLNCSADSEEDVFNVTTALPEDLLDFAMQYCESMSDDDSSMPPDSVTGLEVDVWNSAVEDFMVPDTHSSCNLPIKITCTMPSKIASKLGVNRSAMARCKSLSESDQASSGKSLSQLSMSSMPSAVIQSSVVSSSQHVDSVSAETHDCSRNVSVGGKHESSKVRTGLIVQPIKGCKEASMLKSTTFDSVPFPAPSLDRMVSPVLTDHQYSSARTSSPLTGMTYPSGKRMCTESERLNLSKVRGPTPQFDVGQNALKATSKKHHVILAHPPAKPTMTITPSKSTEMQLHRSVVPVGQKQSPKPASPSGIPVPANGCGKPLAAMSELEKHLRGLVAPPLERRKDEDDGQTSAEECGDAGSKPFLERLLTGEMSHERYRQIDYQLLYQERERLLSETCEGQTS